MHQNTFDHILIGVEFQTSWFDILFLLNSDILRRLKQFGSSSTYDLMLLSNVKYKLEDGPDFCGLLRISASVSFTNRKYHYWKYCNRKLSFNAKEKSLGLTYELFETLVWISYSNELHCFWTLVIIAVQFTFKIVVIR